MQFSRLTPSATRPWPHAEPILPPAHIAGPTLVLDAASRPLAYLMQAAPDVALVASSVACPT
jgi:hypothetical protein